MPMSNFPLWIAFQDNTEIHLLLFIKEQRLELENGSHFWSLKVIWQQTSYPLKGLKHILVLELYVCMGERRVEFR